MKFKRLGIIGRFKPLHKLSARILRSVCENAEKAIIGIGSSNRYNLRNPFTAGESEQMVCRVLKDFDNYEIIQIPDFGHIYEYRDGTRWRDYLKQKFGELDYFVTGNPYVYKLLEGHYLRMHPFDLMSTKNLEIVKGTEVRLAMASGKDWKSLVPQEVAEYLESQGLVDRFREEFGEETIKVFSGKDFKNQSLKSEEDSVKS